MSEGLWRRAELWAKMRARGFDWVLSREHAPMKTTFRSEVDFIAWVKRQAVRRAAGLRLGIGDDAALFQVSPGRELILTTDMSIEGVHFTSNLHPPRAIGHRALARSLSDIAAMGGVPRYALLSLAISAHATRAWLDGFYGGLLALAKRFSVAVIGGDTAIVQGPSTIDVVLAGEIPRAKALRRSGARPGDQLFVSGRLGLAALGLRLLRSRKGAQGKLREGAEERNLHSSTACRKPEEAAALQAHLFPQPQCALGQFLSKRALATALMDLSDGLSLDLTRLCDASGVGARLYQDRIPTPGLPDRALSLELALDGGEDYQLLFTVSPRRAPHIPRRFGRVPLHCIGEIHARKGIRLITPEGKSHTLPPRGYDHFRGR